MKLMIFLGHESECDVIGWVEKTSLLHRALEALDLLRGPCIVHLAGSPPIKIAAGVTTNRMAAASAAPAFPP